MIKPAKGFSLAELIIATAVLALLSVMLVQSFLSIFILNETNRNSSIAISHARYIMEEIKGTDFDNISQWIASGHWDLNTEAVSAKGLTALSAEAIDTEVSGAQLLDVTVTVSWQDRGAKARSIALETFISGS